MRLLVVLSALVGAATPAHAGCDAARLEAELAAASPVAVAGAFNALAACDASAAKAAAPDALRRLLHGDEGNVAAVAAVKVGAADSVAAWIDGLEPDQRSTTLDHLGGRCQAEPAVGTLFADVHARETDRFWADRWYRALADCRVGVVQQILRDAVSSEELAKDRALFFGVLEVYARNLRSDAVPYLEELVGDLEDPREQVLAVAAFADAANVGDPNGTDTAAADQAVAALKRIGPTLPGEAVEQARDTLRALGAEDLAGAFVAHRWPERRADGTYTYLAAVQELVTCKNGKQQGYLHYGDLRERGARWPDDLQSSLLDTLRSHWRLDAAERCKGTAELEYVMTDEPVAGEAAAAEWLDAQRKAFAAKVSGFHKTDEVAEDPIEL